MTTAKIRRKDGWHCFWCNAQVADDAEVCPQCNRTFKASSTRATTNSQLDENRVPHGAPVKTSPTKRSTKSASWWCKHCHKQVSPEAKTCPHCGQPEPATSEVPTEAKLQAVSQIGSCLLVAGLVLVCFVVLFFVCR